MDRQKAQELLNSLVNQELNTPENVDSLVAIHEDFRSGQEFLINSIKNLERKASRVLTQKVFNALVAGVNAGHFPSGISSCLIKLLEIKPSLATEQNIDAIIGFDLYGHSLACTILFLLNHAPDLVDQVEINRLASLGFSSWYLEAALEALWQVTGSSEIITKDYLDYFITLQNKAKNVGIILSLLYQNRDLVTPSIKSQLFETRVHSLYILRGLKKLVKTSLKLLTANHVQDLLASGANAVEKADEIISTIYQVKIDFLMSKFSNVFFGDCEVRGVMRIEVRNEKYSFKFGNDAHSQQAAQSCLKFLIRNNIEVDALYGTHIFKNVDGYSLRISDDMLIKMIAAASDSKKPKNFNYFMTKFKELEIPENTQLNQRLEALGVTSSNDARVLGIITCPISLDYINTPVRIIDDPSNEIFEKHYLLRIPIQDDGSRLHPTTRQPFKIEQVQPAYIEYMDKIEGIMKQIAELSLEESTALRRVGSV